MLAGSACSGAGLDSRDGDWVCAYSDATSCDIKEFSSWESLFGAAEAGAWFSAASCRPVRRWLALYGSQRIKLRQCTARRARSPEAPNVRYASTDKFNYRY